MTIPSDNIDDVMRYLNKTLEKIKTQDNWQEKLKISNVEFNNLSKKPFFN